MNPGNRVLITGVTGFIGSKLKETFLKQGLEVWGISHNREADSRVIQADLSSSESSAQAFSKIPECGIIVHAAALAHSTTKSPEQSYISTNIEITNNLLKFLSKIFLSSIAVYGVDGREHPVTVEDEKRPSSEYGLSKLKCEEAILSSGIKDFFFLRPAPVFDDDHMDDIKKRVYFPGQSAFKILIKPSPKYSLCHINTLTEKIIALSHQASVSPRITNIMDPLPYDQNELAEKFSGIRVPIPSFIFTALINLLDTLPFSKCYAIRCFLAKLFKNNVYK